MKTPKERIIVALILLIFVFALFSVIVSSTSETQLSARAATLYEPTNGEFLFQKNADQRLPMASTTKIMTALVALESTDADAEITVATEACGIEGSSLYLKPNEVLSMRELLYGLMLRSANDAAAAIAYAVGGSIEGFSQLMNTRAKQMGLTDTHFTNPHGLDAPEHYTTAKELAVIAAEALKNPLFKEIVSTYKAEITNSAGESRLVVNHNKLLKLYDGAIGVKTGFTKKCGRCLVGAAERDGLTFISVTIDAPDDWNDHIKLFDLGFSTLEVRRIAKPGDFYYEIPIIGGDSEIIHVSNTDSLSLIMSKSAPEISTRVKLNRYTAAPVSAGDVMGKVEFIQNGTVISELNLYAKETVRIPEKKKLFDIFRK